MIKVTRQATEEYHNASIQLGIDIESPADLHNDPATTHNCE